MVNLLSNAVKFTEAGGSVTVSADTNNDGSTTIFIKDNGIGMTSDEISRAMVPFAKVRHDVTKDQEGTGLGLPLTKMLIEAQGGRLIIESEPDIGTTVKVHFPKELRRNHQSREYA